MTSLESLSLRVSSEIRNRIEHELSEIVTLNDEDASEVMLVCPAETAGCHEPVDEFDRGARLSRRGVEQAQRLARRLQSLWVEQIYFAPEQATEETANILSDIMLRSAACVPDLRDIAFGLQVEDRDVLCDGASAAESFIAHPRWDALPGFEKSKQFRLRVVLALESLVARHPAGRIVVVTHSSLINAFLSMVLDIPRDHFFQPEPSSLSIVRRLNDLYAVRTINDTAHLNGCQPLTRH